MYDSLCIAQLKGAARRQPDVPTLRARFPTVPVSLLEQLVEEVMDTRVEVPNTADPAGDPDCEAILNGAQVKLIQKS